MRIKYDPRLAFQWDQHPCPLLFATISGSHLYAFESPNSEVDLRGVHVLPMDEVRLEAEYHRTKLPGESTAGSALSDLMIRIRKSAC